MPQQWGVFIFSGGARGGDGVIVRLPILAVQQALRMSLDCPISRFAAVLFSYFYVGNHHPSIHGFTHVINGK
jgi:hypothetical protein